MKLYNFTIRLLDTGLPYPSLEEAKKDCEEWANQVAQTENCEVLDIEVMEAN